MGIAPRQTWVTANFKETRTARIRVGQPAVIKPDNATGNFTKVVQRLPTRIALDPNQDGVARRRPGMSVVARVDTAR